MKHIARFPERSYKEIITSCMRTTLSQTQVFALSLKLNQIEIKRAFTVADLGYGYKAAMLPPPLLRPVKIRHM